MRRAGTSSREGTTLAKEETNNEGDKGVKREELLIEHTHACTYTCTNIPHHLTVCLLGSSCGGL